MMDEMETLRSEFIEKCGLMMQSDGLPRIAGRVMGYLIWDGEPVSFGELAEQLQVSRGSISTATRVLENKHIIWRISKPGERGDFFQIASDSYEKMIDNFAKDFRRKSEQLAETIDDIPACETAIRKRVCGYSNFLLAISDAIEQMKDEPVTVDS